MIPFHLLVTLVLSSSAWPLDEPRLFHPVSSARTLKGDELLRIGKIHDVQNHFAEALTYYEQARELFRATKQRQGEATALTRIGLILERQGRREDAAAQLRDALALFSKVPAGSAHGDALEAASWALLASLHEAFGQHQEANESGQRALSIFRRRQIVVHAAQPSANPLLSESR